MTTVQPVYLPALGMVCALGDSRDTILRNLDDGSRAGMVMRDDLLPGREVFVGAVHTALPDASTLPLPFRSRNNQLLLAALSQIRAETDATINRFGANRIAVVLGSSTSGISDGETALQKKTAAENIFPAGFDYRQQEMGNPAQCLAHVLALDTIAYTISTACSSSGKAIAAAARLLHSGVCDAVLCGGVDSLCQMTVQGFAALDSVARTYCNPFREHRDGITIGEGAALFLMTRDNFFTRPVFKKNINPVRLLGAGEASDAFHISAPDPAGAGAEFAIRAALTAADLSPADIDYINLHGTGTRKNDEMESQLVARIFGNDTPCSSTKGMTGHTLGAAGAIEAGLCWLALSSDTAKRKMPPHIADGVPDPALPSLRFCRHEFFHREPAIVMSNSFAFGGNNISLILSG
ncbi:MAG TPA: beta-ketoacyl-[acyl-carrier-protein] synthase family protein [Pseudomonadales bacterium]|nr:beta-ketoacyl-[acyl-carrier-protein] synthase family protein [Pseudomonadales bacterium]